MAIYNPPFLREMEDSQMCYPRLVNNVLTNGEYILEESS